MLCEDIPIEKKKISLIALCNCLINDEVWNLHGTDIVDCLITLLIFLEEKYFQVLHIHVIKSLCLMSHRNAIASTLRQIGLVEVLTKYLKDFLDQHKCTCVRNKKPQPSANAHALYINNVFGSFDAKLSFDKDSSAGESSEKFEQHAYEESKHLIELVSEHVELSKVRFVKFFLTDGLFKITEIEDPEENVTGVFRSLNRTRLRRIKNSKISTIDHHVLYLLWRLCFLNTETILIVAKASCCILDYMTLVSKPSTIAVKILLKLAVKRICFEEFILNGFILGMDKILILKNILCSHNGIPEKVLSILNTLTEFVSKHGMEVLGSYLIHSDVAVQLKTLHAISKLIVSKDSWMKFLSNGNGMQMFQMLTDDCLSICKASVIALCIVYQSMVSPSLRLQKTTSNLFLNNNSKECFYEKPDFNITFSVDSGENVLGNKDILCNRSEYFKSLLAGYFLESKADFISLKDISAESLTAIFHFLYGCSSESSCGYLKNLSISILFELLSDCERFLLENLKEVIACLLYNKLCYLQWDSTSEFYLDICSIYEHAKVYKFQELALESLKAVLNMHPLEEPLWKCFNELLSLDKSLDFLGDLKKLFFVENLE